MSPANRTPAFEPLNRNELIALQHRTHIIELHIKERFPHPEITGSTEIFAVGETNINTLGESNTLAAERTCPCIYVALTSEEIAELPIKVLAHLNDHDRKNNDWQFYKVFVRDGNNTRMAHVSASMLGNQLRIHSIAQALPEALPEILPLRNYLKKTKEVFSFDHYVNLVNTFWLRKSDLNNTALMNFPAGLGQSNYGLAHYIYFNKSGTAWLLHSNNTKTQVVTETAKASLQNKITSQEYITLVPTLLCRPEIPEDEMAEAELQTAISDVEGYNTVLKEFLKEKL